MERGFTRRGLIPFEDLAGTFWFFMSQLMNGNSKLMNGKSTPLSKTLT